MEQLSRDTAEKLLAETELQKVSSNLGYFSKPYRIDMGKKALIIKLYLPVRSSSLVSSIITNHDKYVNELRDYGLRIPETVIFCRPAGNKQQIVIIQEAFRDDELLRNQIARAGKDELQLLCHRVFDDIIRFRKRMDNSQVTGFHPTLRNYAVHEGNLHYFDTFPPMMMKQRDLNSIIVKMSPYGKLIKGIIPLKMINRVTDEYYQIGKMFTGIVGSCCRLRPQHAEYILRFSRDYVRSSENLKDSDKNEILALITSYPALPKIWILVRNLTGNTGEPNYTM